MTNRLIGRAEEGKYGDLFRLDLFWGAPNHPPIEVDLGDGLKLTATNISSYQGVRVWEVPALPGSAGEAKIDQAISKTSTNRLVIFHDGDKQVWRWPSRTTRGSGVISRPARHVHKAGSNDPKFVAKLDAIRLPTDVQIDVNELLSRVRGAFDVETKNESKRASKLMAQMYAAVEKGYAPAVDPKKRDHEISATMARVLFLLFGDDTEMWKDSSGEPMPDLFQDFIKDHTERDGSDIAARLNALFRALDTAPNQRKGLAPELAAFPYVNGGIFDEKINLPDLDNDFRKAILDACAVDWSTISPAIFGSMFQSVRDAQTRRELGEHYTSEENILKTLNPLFLDDLRAEFDAALARDTDKKKENALNALWAKLGNIRYMDPACGCGNFIIVAYRELRDLELRIMEALQDLSGYAQLAFDPTLSLRVTLDHFYGIEIDEWPARIAETAMFLIDRQSDLKMKERFGVAPERLPIQRAARIIVGNAMKLDWAEVCPAAERVIVAGNPPFLGHATRSEVQAEELRAAWGRDDISRLDYVTGWHAKALRYFENRNGEWAFVTTNSITQGDPVPLLFGPIFDAGWRIKFAHRTFPWTSDAAGKAAVHCVIVGFGRDVKNPVLFDEPSAGGGVRAVKSINAYLADAPNAFIVKRMTPLGVGLPETTFGNMPRDDGNLIVTADELADVRSDPIASKYLRPFIGADELLNGRERWCLWLVGAEEDIPRSDVLSRRVEAVREFRKKSTAASTRQMAETAHLFGQRPGLHSQPYVVIPRVSSDRRPYFAAMHVTPDVIASDATFTASDPDGFLFGIISSAIFVAWQRAVGGRLKSDLRFSNTIVWNNLPLPPVNPDLRRQIADAGRAVQQVRESRPGLTLAQQYLPENFTGDLVEAHVELDRLVDRVWSGRRVLATEQERQSVLFEAYVRETKGLL
ncbi:class I SAM-dependent DNA methyltransferase [Nocardioides taihuensis]|uniref:site-specific DNA-methyltransferase (adenine-specific) n=1 Tax=Nocardioides taihuensis TaxID=1835606 RepID=A0ABW0BJB3_9ACTN